MNADLDVGRVVPNAPSGCSAAACRQAVAVIACAAGQPGDKPRARCARRLADNTLVLFLSDNGATNENPNRGKPGAALGSRDSCHGYGLGWANVSNTPFRFYKHWVSSTTWTPTAPRLKTSPPKPRASPRDESPIRNLGRPLASPLALAAETVPPAVRPPIGRRDVAT